MPEIDSITGLPKELGAWENITKESQKLSITTEKRKFGKIHTIVDGFTKEIDVKDLTKKLKNQLACGGTYKDGRVELLGEHTVKVRDYLEKHGFSI